jgi:hypothetical protein
MACLCPSNSRSQGSAPRKRASAFMLSTYASSSSGRYTGRTLHPRDIITLLMMIIIITTTSTITNTTYPHHVIWSRPTPHDAINPLFLCNTRSCKSATLATIPGRRRDMDLIL